jgi:hypothetical protein
MNRWKISTMLFAGLFVSTLGLNLAQNAAHADRQQRRMESALESLKSALDHLEHAEHDKGGWRTAAVEATRTAIHETERGIRFDEHEHEHR